jgi:autotransporter translocation and assembly factor TamB
MNGNNDITNNQEQPGRQSRIRFRWLRAALFLLAGVLLLLVMLRLALRSEFLLDQLRPVAEKQVSALMNGELRIGSLRGDLLSGLRIADIRLIDINGEPVVTVDSLTVRYQVWQALRGMYNIDEISLYRPRVMVSQPAEDRWNVLELFKVGDDEDNEPQSVNIKINQFDIHDGFIELISPWLLPDDEISVNELNLQASFSMAADDFRAGLHQLDFKLSEGRLPESVVVDMAGSTDGTLITLERLMINTGRTLLETTAAYRTDGSETSLQTMLDPLSWRDLMAYTEEPMLLQDVYLQLGVRGSVEDLTLDLGLRAQGMDEIRLEVRGGLPGLSDTNPDLNPFITAVNLHSEAIDLPLLTGNNEWPTIQSLELSLQGMVQLNAPEMAILDGNITVKGLRSADQGLDEFHTTFSLNEGIMKAALSANQQEQQIRGNLSLTKLFDQNPGWKLSAQGRAVEPAVWVALPETSPNAVFTFQLQAEGNGLEPAAQPWTASLEITDARLEDQVIQRATLTAEIDSQNLRLMSVIVPKSGELHVNASLDNWKDDLPEYQFYAETERFDLREIHGFDGFPTTLTLRMLGEGVGFDPSTMQMQATLEMSESVVNGAQIDRLQSDIQLSNGILQLRDTFLESTLAQGRLDVRQDITNIMDPGNRVDFQLRLGDIQPLAPLAGLYLLEASGEIKGTLSPGARQIPTIDALVELQDIAIDSTLIASVNGRLEVLLERTITVASDLRMSSITITDWHLDDIWLRAEGTLVDSLLRAGYLADITLDSASDMRISTQGNITGTLPPKAPPGPFQLETTVLNLRDADLHYGLRQPFSVYFADERFRMDPLILTGDSGVELQLEAEQYSTTAYRGRFMASDVHLGTLQRVLMAESMAEGLLNGSIFFDIDLAGDQLEISAEIGAKNIDVDGFEIDDLSLALNLAEHRLNFTAESNRNGETWFQADVDLPFRPGDPAVFEPAFFERSVSGRIRMLPLNLGEEAPLTELIGIDGVSGVVRFDATLSGTAGEPGFEVDFSLVRGRVSGVTIDTLQFNAGYNHNEKEIRAASRLVSLGQVAATLDGVVPFQFDAPTLGFGQPEGGSDLQLQLNSNRFNLAALNQFADPQFVRDISGLLNADLKINGSYDQPAVTGQLSLAQGSLLLTEQNVTFRDIQTSLTFGRDRIQLDRFSVQSTGSLTASGDILLQGFVPQSVDIGVRARNFRIYNTRDIQALISMDTRLGGGFNNPRLTGTFELDRGYVYLDNFGERTVEEVILDEEDSSMFDGIQFWKDLAMELQFSTRRNFWVRNRSRPELELELDGVLELVKYPDEDIQVFGNFGASEGFVNQLGRRFELEDAELTFSGPPENPTLNVRSLYTLRQPTDVRIWYVIEGTAAEPRFRWESDPVMELQDIISYTLFGRPFHSLMAWQQTTASRSDGNVTDAALDILLDRVEQLATQALGIDVLQIDNTRTGGQSGTTIKAGKYLSDRVFVAILQELGATVSSQVMLEYELRRNLDLIITGSDNNRTGIDIQWRKDY